MSRIGKQSIEVPAGITVETSGRTLTASSAKSSVSVDLPAGVELGREGDTITVSIAEGTHPSAWGLGRSLIANAVDGVSKGFEKRLLVVGVGYRAQASGSKLTLSVGYSHDVVIEAPEGISFEIEQNTSITHRGDSQPAVPVVVKGADKQVVGDIAAKIRSVRKPEPYLGKGIRYADERVRTDKVGKAAR